jgi:hypothetical protein
MHRTCIEIKKVLVCLIWTAVHKSQLLAVSGYNCIICSTMAHPPLYGLHWRKAAVQNMNKNWLQVSSVFFWSFILVLQDYCQVVYISQTSYVLFRTQLFQVGFMVSWGTIVLYDMYVLLEHWSSFSLFPKTAFLLFLTT